MGLDKYGFYTCKDILKEEALYNIIIGERAPGKSYGVKREAINYAWKHKTPTIGLLRRYEEDIKNNAVTEYFADNNSNEGHSGDISKITGREYDTLFSYQSDLYFGSRDPDSGQLLRGICSGKSFALNSDERYKSRQFPYMHDIIFEEFVTNKIYLRDECTRLQNFVSTLFRKREGRVWMIANTISRVCPYFYEWGLSRIPYMEPGQIDTYYIDDTKIAVEFAPSAPAKSRMFFGKAAKSIQGGQWETNSYSSLPDDYAAYDIIYEMHLKTSYFEHLFLIQLLVDDDGDQVVFIQPVLKKVFPDLPTLSDEFNISRNVHRYLRRDHKAERTIARLFAENKVCYSSNLTGADFNGVIRNTPGIMTAH